MLIRLSDSARLYHADCRDAIKSLPDNSIDSVVTDPPYGLQFMGAEWDKLWRDRTDVDKAWRDAHEGTLAARARKLPDYSTMSKGADMQETHLEWAKEVFRVLKPGGHIAAFSASRTYHRMACAIEDAGFEIRDSLMWVYGTGFPKSHDVSKGIDKLDAADMRLQRRYQFTEWFVTVCSLTGRQMDEICSTNTMGRHWTDCRPNGKQPDVPTREYFEMLRPHISGPVPQWIEQMVDERTIESENFKRREVVGKGTAKLAQGQFNADAMGSGGYGYNAEYDLTKPATDAAREWEGWGTALKPAFEPIVLARKPLSEGTVAANVLRWGTGALNIDGCRVPTDETINIQRNVALGSSSGGVYGAATTPGVYVQKDEGRWPANVVHDGSDEVVGAFPNTSSGKAAVGGHKRKDSLGSNSTVNIAGRADENAGQLYGDSGSAARFFYSAKASKADRNGSKHPTVKPIALMEWLATLITPPGGTILDPFAGSGTTGAAAARRGFRCVLVEREDEYVEDIKRRFGARPVDPLARLLAWNRAVASYRAGKSKVAA